MGSRSDLEFSTASEVIRERLRALSELSSAVRSGEPSAIHDMRVASRRVRAALTEFEHGLPSKPARRLRKWARAITRALGKARELDVTLHRLRDLHDDMPPAVRAQSDQLTAALQDERAQHVSELAEIADLVQSSAFATRAEAAVRGCHPAQSCGVRRGRRRLRKHLRRVRTRYRKWLRSHDDDDLHLVRVAFKKLRYACESYAPARGPEFSKLIKKLRTIQEALGDWNDYRILQNHARRIMADSGNLDSAFMRDMMNLIDRRVIELRSAFAPLAEEFFARPPRERLHAVLRGPV